MIRSARKKKLRHRRFRPKVERLEARLPFAADGLSLDFDLGEVTEGLDPAEFTVVGGQGSNIADAEGVALPGGGHLFLYAEQRSDMVELWARGTSPEGTPGDAPKLLTEVQLGATTAPEQVRFAGRATMEQGLIFTWTDGTTIYTQRFDADLNPESQAVEVAAGTSSLFGTFGDTIDLQVLVLPDKTIGVGYTDPVTGLVSLKRYTESLEEIDLYWQDTQGQTTGTTPPLDLSARLFADGSVKLTWSTTDLTLPQEWTLHTATFFSGASHPIERWTVSGFVGPPQLGHLSDGRLVLAGAHAVAGGSQTIVQLLDAQRNLLVEHLLAHQPTTQGDLSSLAVLDDDLFAVSFLTDVGSDYGFFLQPFTAGGQRIGVPISLNHAPVFGDLHGRVFGLPTGGFASYWLGFALDGISPAVFSRTLKLETTEVHVDVEDPDSQLSASLDYLWIEGLPEDVGLNVGDRVSETAWRVALADVNPLKLLYLAERESLSLNVQLVSGATQEVLASSRTTFGSEDDDALTWHPSTDYVHGRAGEDTLFVDAPLGQLSVDELPGGLYRLSNELAAFDFIFADIENFEFSDALLSLGQLLESGAADGNQNENQAAPDEGASNDNEEVADGDLATPPVLSQPLPLPSKPLLPARPPKSPGREHLANPPAAPAALPPHVARAPLPRPSDAEPPAPSQRLAQRADKPNADAKAPAMPPPSNVAPRLFQSSIATATYATAPKSTVSPDAFQVPRQSLFAPAPAFTNRAAPPGAPVGFHVPPLVLSSLETTTYPTSALTIAPTFDVEQLFENVDTLEEEVESQQFANEVVAGSAIVLATGFSLAHIAWLLRGSVLISKLLSSMPIWISFDPLPMLREGQTPSTAASNHESLADIVKNAP